MRTAFIGGGSFGTALAKSLSENNHEVVIYDRSPDTVNEINNNHTNRKYLKDVFLNANIKAVNNLKDAIVENEVIVLSIPSNAVRETCEKIKPYLNNNHTLVSIAKGIDPLSLKALSQVIEETLNTQPVILSGPSHAEEVAINLPTTMVSTSKDHSKMIKIQSLFSSSTLRVYTNPDVVGVETGAAVKNIIALAAGISDGIGFGDNAKAALMTRGMSEIIKIGTACGAKKDTFYGLTGIGDLIVTCTSMHSRNRRAGILIGQGKSMDEATKEIGMVVEGIKATLAFRELSRKMRIEMPITEAVYSVLFEGVRPIDAVRNLMLRDLKME